MWVTDAGQEGVSLYPSVPTSELSLAQLPQTLPLASQPSTEYLHIPPPATTSTRGFLLSRATSCRSQLRTPFHREGLPNVTIPDTPPKHHFFSVLESL